MVRFMEMKITMDVKLLMGIILAIIAAFMIAISSGGGRELKKLIKEREEQNERLQQQIDARNEDILRLEGSILVSMEQDRLKAERITELERVRDSQQRSLNDLRNRMNGSSKLIENATDEKRLEFWRDYFERKGIEQ